MLKDEIDAAKHNVNTDTVQMTIGEIGNMYNSNELNILPDFQRLFRWTPEKKSNFIESILIGIPIPPAFVYEKSDGTWELIDGLQRISTVLEFMGILKDPDTGEPRRSRLQKTKYLPSLENVVWEAGGGAVNEEIFERPDEDLVDLGSVEAEEAVEEAGIAIEQAAVAVEEAAVTEGIAVIVANPAEAQPERVLDKALQLFFRRHRMDFQILKYPSDQKTKFDLFQRLNRGGAYANEQEVRTCAMVLANGTFTTQIREFAAADAFQRIFKISSEQRKNQKDIEYAVRSIVHTYVDFERGKDVQEFLDDAILKIITERAPGEVLETVYWAVNTLHAVLGDDALIPPKGKPAGIANRFSLRALEGIVVGLARNRAAIIDAGQVEAFVTAKVEEFWKQPDIQTMASPGLRGTVRLQRTVAFGSQWFNPNAEH
ncbi:DUF262 domain-containing protein [Mesorhizobium sp. M1005]|uniref:DUF262 domain-containing protein n=1 Tax=unclassified Mesorhizobium TaxID=325217 RepID=UPI003336B536